MTILALDHLQPLLAGSAHSAKMVLNERGCIFLPTSSQHRDHKADGISYEDNYKGNALAAIITRGRVEIRYHEDFIDARVGAIVGELLAHPDLAALTAWCADWHATYQGRDLAMCRHHW